MASKPTKLTTTSYALLALLDQLGEGTSYDIKQALDKSIENFWPVPHTTAYDEPARLAQAGYLSVDQEAGGRRRKSYSLTEEGRRALREWAAEPVVAPPQLRDEFMLKVFAGADPGALVEQRLAWHRAKLDELGGYLENVRAAGGYEASERSLLAGLAYHRRMIEMIEELSG
jgi:PadR family transcriptional regulator, regulatory protein AphA